MAVRAGDRLTLCEPLAAFAEIVPAGWAMRFDEGHGLVREPRLCDKIVIEMSQID